MFTATQGYVRSVPHNSNSLISNYHLFRRPPSAPKITPLTTLSWLHQKFAYLESKVPHLKFRVMRDRVYINQAYLISSQTTQRFSEELTKESTCN